MRPLLSPCIVSYNKKSEDKRDYFPSWVAIDNHTTVAPTSPALLDAFVYQSEAELKGVKDVHVDVIIIVPNILFL